MAQGRRKEPGIMKEEMIVEELVIQEILADLINTAHLLTQQEGLMHMKTP
jgi:hypothetical protein